MDYASDIECGDRIYIVSLDTFGTFIGYIEDNKSKIFINGKEHMLDRNDIKPCSESFNHKY